MKYAEARRNIKSGDLLAWSHRGWNSLYDVQIQAIRVFTQSEYCHVGLAWVIGGRVFVLEAVTPKIRIYPLSKLGEFYWLPLGAQWRPETEEFALSKVGEVYSKWQAVKSYFKPLRIDNKWQCAEYARQVLLRNGVDLGEKVTPSAIVKAAQEYGAPLYLVTQE